MCGIIGILGTGQEAPNQVFKGLAEIEYRGYDSWGVASFNNSFFEITKKIGFLPQKISLPNSNIALGHTRWATHGGVTVENAHPHSDCSKKLALVHNGIVENHDQLKKQLKNHKFLSETDSEIIVHLIEEQLKKQPNLYRAVQQVFTNLEGLNAIVISDGYQIVAAKKGSPLVLGQTTTQKIIASDPAVVLPYTDQLLFLEDDQIVVLDQDLSLFSATNNQKLKPNFKKVVWHHEDANLGKYPNFMYKEMHQQPQVLQNIVLNHPETKKIADLIKSSYGCFFIACGSASYTCLAGVYLFSKYAKRHINFSIGSEFNYIKDYLTSKSLLIAVSQSGESIDTIEPVKKALNKKTKVVSLVNVLGSTLYRMADYPVLLQAGPEKAVASTKAVIAMVANILLLAMSVANKKAEGEKIIIDSSHEIKRILENKNKIHQIAKKIKTAKNIYVLGRGLSYPLALETALKIKEISYIHAEGFPGGELKHGPIALITQGTPVICFVPNDETKEGILANATEVKARGAFLIGVGVEKNQIFDEFFEVKDCGASSILPHLVFSQLLAYFLTIELKLNPDKPRNLAKSVVVR